MRRRELAIFAAGWLALVTMYAAAFVTNGLAAGMALRNAFANLFPDAILGLALLRLPSRLSWPDARKGRFFAVHAGLMIAFITASAAGWIALVVLDSWLFSGPFRISFRVLPFRVVIDVLIYCTLTGISYASSNAAQLHEQAERAARAEALRARASLEAMRSQLNPHFILNTFHALVGLVRREPAIAEGALERLGDLLRYSLRIQRDGIDEVPLRDECAFVDSYLALERLRLADRLRVSVDTPPATMDCLVPTFALQILVENAIRHAIAPRAAGGRLHIRAEQTNGRLRVAVTDESTMEPVIGSNDGAHIGLHLLQERLTALYGNRAKLSLRSVDGGTCADLDLPARRSTDEDAQ
jgi:hypothetical protein